MSQNTSHAVMAQRSEPNDSLDDFPTQPWGTRALVEHVLKPRFLRLESAWEPAANRGYMARPLAEYFDEVHASDVHDYGEGYPVDDFLFPGSEGVASVLSGNRAGFRMPEWIITNPPFRLAEQFIGRARALAITGVAMLVRTAFLESVGRFERLFSVNPPTIVAQFVERLPMVKGRIDRIASTATAYCWCVWIHGREPEPFQWIPPCRARLERDSDYRSAA